MRIIEYAPRKLNQYGYVYTVSNAYIRAEDGTVLDVAQFIVLLIVSVSLVKLRKI